MTKNGYKRKTKGSKAAPYGYRKDGKPKGKPGRKTGPPKPKRPKKRPGPKPKPKRQKNPKDMRGKVRVNRGGLKKDGTPMPPTHTADGRLTKEGARQIAKKGAGRPKGSYSMDRLIREELRKMYGKDGAKTKGEELIKRLVDQAISSGQKRGTLARFLTERMDGKAVQPIKDVTPRDPLDGLTDEELDELIASRGMPSVSPVPEHNKDAPEPSPSPTEERSPESSGSEGAPPPPKKAKTK